MDKILRIFDLKQYIDESEHRNTRSCSQILRQEIQKFEVIRHYGN